MSETTAAHMASSLPKSSDFNKDAWRGAKPTELIHEGYTKSIDVAPRQAQSTVEDEIKSEDVNNSKGTTPTTISFQGNLTSQLRTPDPTPETRHWVTLHALQEWEGYVIHIGDIDFSVRLRDLTAEHPDQQVGRSVEEEATIPLSEISDDDYDRLHPGSVFRWIIGYERAASGTKRRVSQIIFRDLPSVSEQDRSEGTEWANRVMLSLSE